MLYSTVSHTRSVLNVTRLPQLVLVASIFCFGAALSACMCSPANPSPVTIRVKNDGAGPIFVNDTGNQLGATVERQVGGSWYGFDDTPCVCTTCERACTSLCECPQEDAFVRKIESGSSAERTWNGVVQISDLACETACVSPENAPLDETFRVTLCYANEVAGFVAPDGGRGPGLFPNTGTTCVERTFKPVDGVVEVGPVRGAACTVTAECAGDSELCLYGSCTASCPASDVPTNLGLRIASPTDRGFFTTKTTGTRMELSGTGTLTGAQYNDSTLSLSFSRKGAAQETLTASVQVTMPTRDGPALSANANVDVLFVDDSTSANPGNRALVIRDAITKQLLFVADVAQQARVLKAADVTPFTLKDESDAVGCRLDQCGKVVFLPVTFTGMGLSVTVAPGKAQTATAGTTSYRFLNAWNGRYGMSTRCDFTDLRPYAIWKL